MISKRHISATSALAALAILSATAASAQLVPNFDHLKCYKITDSIKGVYKVNLIPQQAPPFAIEQGCKLVVPAKLFCIDVKKVVVAPTPPMTVNGGNARDYLCYKIACPGKIDFTLSVRDQFGQRPIKVKPPKFLCAPAEKVAQPTPTPTSTPPPPPPTATRTPGCDFLAATGKCGGPCPLNEQCVFVVDPLTGVSDCDCRPPNPACHPAGTNACVGPCPDPRDQCRDVGPAGAIDCECNHPCSLDPSNAATPPQCSGDCPVPGDVCVLIPGVSCDCHPPTAPPCGNTLAPTCDGGCPNPGEACVPTGPAGSPCFCENGTPPACGLLAGGGNPQCLGACPANLACISTGPVPGGTCICQ
jgi:hypothetical protein